ncbi:unnamed protein product [Ilex paraguariensis]|uniref:Uncharacterized protein n=1 Tax=Ilex paraguariensis TaxID=185542 RepID=A0ABC8REL6_9AQUA
MNGIHHPSRDLMAWVNNLQFEVESFRSQKGELEEQVIHTNNRQQELEILLKQKTDSEACLEKKDHENPQCLISIEEGFTVGEGLASGVEDSIQPEM